MNKIKILYWLVTSLFAAFMLSSSIPDLILSPDAVTFITHLGYPVYFIPFIGVAKLIGAIVILIPRFSRLKEWAYAGLFFDLLAAFYSIIAVNGFESSLIIMLLPMAFLFWSYFLWHKIKT